MDDTKQIAVSELAKHATPSDCWIAIEGKVYNVTDFIPGHPGGQIITTGCGKDATTMFNSRPNDGTSHSTRARDLLSGYQIGTLNK
jgi:cytochrome b involved in lipid metabolism